MAQNEVFHLYAFGHNLSGLKNQRTNFRATTSTRQCKSPKIERERPRFCKICPDLWMLTESCMHEKDKKAAHQRFWKLNWDSKLPLRKHSTLNSTGKLPPKTKITALVVTEMIHNVIFIISRNEIKIWNYSTSEESGKKITYSQVNKQSMEPNSKMTEMLERFWCIYYNFTQRNNWKYAHNEWKIRNLSYKNGNCKKKI